MKEQLSSSGNLFPDSLCRLLTAEELAITGSVIYSSLFQFPVKASEVEQTLLSSATGGGKVADTFNASPRLGKILDHEQGYFFPKGCREFIRIRREREARSRQFVERYRLILSFICSIPFTRMVALSGSAAHLNMGESKDLDLMIICRGSKVWSVSVIGIILARILRCRKSICINFVLADNRLRLEQQDLFNANQLIHLRPLLGTRMFKRLLSENPFVQDFYPAFVYHQDSFPRPSQGPMLMLIKGLCELLLWPGPGLLLERVTRRWYRAHLKKRAHTWTSPEAVTLESDCLKLHSHSHRQEIMRRFHQAMEKVAKQLEKGSA